MRGFKCFGYLLGDGQGFVEWDRSSLDPIRQGRSFNQFENERTGIVFFL